MRTKHVFSVIFALAMALMTSCTEQYTVTGTEVGGATRSLTFNVSADGGAHTRATSPTAPSVTGYKMQYVLQVLDASGNSVNLGSGTQVSNETGSFEVDLPMGVTYTCLFWAQYISDGGGDNAYFNTGDLEAVALKQHLSADDRCQAFCATADVAADQAAATTTVTLKRAVAQVNLKSNTSLEYFEKMEATYSDVPNTFNVKDNLVSTNPSGTAAPGTFTITAKPAMGADNKFTYHTVYFLAPGDGSANLLKIKLETFSTGDATPIQTLSINDVPTKKNYKTNVTTTLDAASFITNYTFDFAEWEATELRVKRTSRWDGNYPAYNPSYSFESGSGSAADPYVIGSAEDFAQLAANVNGGTDYEDVCFLLDTHIDLQNNEWTPIGIYTNESDKHPFKGIFDGDHSNITGLNITSDKLYVGLFGYVGIGTNASSPDTDACHATIKNLHVNGTVTATNTTLTDIGTFSEIQASAGGICGYGSDVISGCSFEGSVTAATNAGGIVGMTYESDILACKNAGTIVGGNNIGGIVGYQKMQTIVYACYNEGQISNNGSGLIGAISGNSYGPEDVIYASYNIGLPENAAIVTGNYCYTKGSVPYGAMTFGAGSWPSASDHFAWTASPTADGSFTYEESGGVSSCQFWKSLGGWNGGTPEYPKLWWEK